jgi:IS30 family transposase
MEKFGYLQLSDEVRSKILVISPATVDRILYPVRQRRRGHGLSTTRSGQLLKSQVPIRTFGDWNDLRPGFSEADLVAHCGTTVAGSYLHTLTITDVATGWTECVAILVRDQNVTLRAIRQAREQLPLPLLGLDTDNGGEFLNYQLLEYCLAEEITFTRARPYRKNDQCHVEQKNGDIVRRYIGYDRYDGVEPCRIMNALYERLRLYVNFFQPSLKLVKKVRDGARVSKFYDEAKTPYQRILASELVADDIKTTLRGRFEQLDPVRLLWQIEQLQDALWRHANIATSLVVDSDRTTIQPKMSRNGEQLPVPVAPTHSEVPEPVVRKRRQYRRTKRLPIYRYWRTRKDPFAAVWPEIEVQLAKTPNVTGKMLFEWLCQRHPGAFKPGQLRTLQRRVREWRLKLAKEPLESDIKNCHQLPQDEDPLE